MSVGPHMVATSGDVRNSGDEFRPPESGPE